MNEETMTSEVNTKELETLPEVYLPNIEVKEQPPTLPSTHRPDSSGGDETEAKMRIEGLEVHYGAFHAIKNAWLNIPVNRVTALIGPSGCGKSTFLRALNRMHDLQADVRIDGRVTLDGEDIYATAVDPVGIRHR